MTGGRGRRVGSGGGGWLTVGLAALILVSPGILTSCSAPVEATEDERGWVEARLEAYATLFNITPEGRELIHSLDVRRMEGRPAWFGSTGYRGFTGVGQARMGGLAHELGHSYWGAFPVTGHPELSWERSGGEGVSTAMAQYHADLRQFMAQPADRYEPLRERFRNFPNLNIAGYSDLLHAGEADIPRLTAGDLGLAPPILRKYFDRFMTDREYESWAELMGWYSGLVGEDRRLADSYLQLSHVPREAYSGVGAGGKTGLGDEVRDILVREERQRLVDFVEQFEQVLNDSGSLRDAANVDRGFPYWRGYLREMFALHKRYPEIVKDYELREGVGTIASAFEALESVEGRGVEEASAILKGRLDEDPFLFNFLPIVENQLLLAVLEPGDDDHGAYSLPKGATAFVEELRHFAADVEAILESGEGDSGEGARVLEAHVRAYGTGDPTKLQQNVDTLLELLFSTDREAAAAIMDEISGESAVDLLKLSPVQARTRLRPAKLVDALGIMEDASTETFREGIRTLFDNRSGNFAIDRWTNEEAYSRVLARGHRDPRGTLEIIKDVSPRVPQFIAYDPLWALEILGSDLEVTLDLVLESEAVRTPSARLIYQIMYFDADFAAEIVSGLGRRGEEEVVKESLAYFAYDLERSREYPEQRISLERDGEFLSGLVERNGAWWVSRMLRGAVERYSQEVRLGNVDRDFLEAYRETLRAAVATIEGSLERELVGRAVGEGLGVGRPHL